MLKNNCSLNNFGKKRENMGESKLMYYLKNIFFAKSFDIITYLC